MKNEITTETAEKTPSQHRLGKVVKIALCLIILSAGIAGATYINKTAPKARKKPPKNNVPLVQTEPLHRSTERVMVQAMGTVIPAHQVLLKSRVSGEVVKTHSDFTEGGLLKKGAVVLQLDPKDYKLAVTQKQSQVVNAQYQLKLEMGQQDVAKREWELLNGERPAKEQDAELALRKPHLEKAKADLAAAESELSQAKLDLSRTTIRTPFNAVVQEKNVEIGSQVSAQEQLAALIGTDAYWIRVAVPVERLKWITIPRRAGEKGSRVKMSYGNGADAGFERTGTVVKLLSNLETDGRMARLLVEVKDPLSLKVEKNRPPDLLLGDYVRVEIEGHEIDDVHRIPRTALRDDSVIWVTGKDEKLHIREVKTLWRDRDTVFFRDGIKPEELLIVSDLQSPVEGMDLRINHNGDTITAKQSIEKHES